MTADKYLDMCQQLGKEPILDEIPVAWEDLPILVQHSINLYSKLGDRIVGDIGFIGKDYTNLALLLDLYDIENKELAVDIITWLDNRAIKKSSDAIKKERDKIKSKAPKGGSKKGYP